MKHISNLWWQVVITEDLSDKKMIINWKKYIKHHNTKILAQKKTYLSVYKVVYILDKVYYLDDLYFKEWTTDVKSLEAILINNRFLERNYKHEQNSKN